MFKGDSFPSDLISLSKFNMLIFRVYFLWGDKNHIFFSQLPEEKEALLVTEEYQEQMSESTFLFLTLDLPTAPLYKDEKEQLIIPQVPLFNILGKFNGSTEKVLTHSNVVLDVKCTINPPPKKDLKQCYSAVILTKKPWRFDDYVLT